MTNILTSLGKAIVTARLLGNTQTLPVNIGWGTGAGTSAVADTALFTEDAGGTPAYARVAGTATQQTTTVNSDTYQVVGTLVANAAKTITNAGLFDAATGGNLFFHGDFTGVALNLNDSLTLTFKVAFT